MLYFICDLHFFFFPSSSFSWKANAPFIVLFKLLYIFLLFQELRVEDYTAGRKSKQTGSTGAVSLFGQAPASQASAGGFVFGGGLGSGLQSSSSGFGSEYFPSRVLEVSISPVRFGSISPVRFWK